METWPNLRAEPTLTRRDAEHSVGSDWRERLPVLAGRGVTLRALELFDAPTLFTMLTAEEVQRFISPPPQTVAEFERFITWTRRQQAEGRYVCFGIVPEGWDVAVGLIQIRSNDVGFTSVEWGFAIGSMFWGTGMFQESARMAIDFAIGDLGTERLEARASVENGRGNGALRKLGAEQEGRLRGSFVRNGRHVDQLVWTITRAGWLRRMHAKTVWGARIH